MLRSSTLVALLLPLGCCAGTSTTGTTGAVSHRTTGTSGTSGTSGASGTTGLSSGGGTTGSTTSSTGTSTGTSAASCPTDPAPSSTDCDAGLAEAWYFAVDELTKVPITQQLSFTDLNDPASSAQTSPCGVFYFCVVPGHVLAVDLAAPSFQATLLADLPVPASLDFGSIGLFSQQEFDDEVESLPSTQALDPNLASVAITIHPLGATLCNAGWTFQLYDLDGGLVQGQPAFVSGPTINAEAFETDGAGAVVIYNIDPAAGPVTVAGTHDGGSPPDGGCTFGGYDQETDGVIRLRSGYLSRIRYFTE